MHVHATALVCLLLSRNGFPVYGVRVPRLSCSGGDLVSTALHCFIQPEGAIMKRKHVASAPGGPAASVEGLAKLPQLGEWMTSTTYEDGASRQLPTMTFWCQNGEWKVNLRDRSEGLCLWLSAATWVELVKLINDACQDESYPWRKDEFGDPDKGKRVKGPSRG